jgi:6-phosphogluconolactonase
MAFQEYNDRNILARDLATAVAGALARRIAAAGQAWLAVSGGSTPERFFKQLSSSEIEWDKVIVTLVDERCITPSCARSNMGLVARLLLQDRAASAKFIPLYEDAAITPEQAVRRAESILSECGQIDACILGMGMDGHTASLFPDGDNLVKAMDMNSTAHVSTMRAPAAKEPRLTLTLPVILGSRFLALHIEGEEKRAVYEKACDPGPVLEMPIRAVIRNAGERLEVYWAP